MPSESESAESEQQSVELLSRLEEGLDAIEGLKNEIEQRGEAKLEELRDPALSAKHQKILEALEKENESFLKKMSSALGEYAKSFAASFRDKRILNAAESLDSSMNGDKTLIQYHNASWSRGPMDGALQQKAEAAFNRHYKKISGLLQTIEHAEWGTSKYTDGALRKVNKLLESVATYGSALGNDTASFRALSVYENNDQLRSYHDSKFNDVLSKMAKRLKWSKEDFTKENIEADCHDNPLLILESISGTSFQNGFDRTFFEEQIDALIEKYPDGGTLSFKAKELYADALKANPEKYALDPKNRRAMFGVLTSGKSSSMVFDKRSLGTMHFFRSELSALSPAEITDLIENYSRYDFRDKETQSLLAALPLEEENFKKIYEKIFADEVTPKAYTKERLIEAWEKKIHRSQGLQIPFMQFKKFGLDPATRVDFFKKIVKECYSDDFAVLGNIFSNFNEVFEGIPEEDYGETLSELIKKTAGSEVEQLRGFYALLPEYDIPAKYKEEFTRHFAAKYGRDGGTVLGLNQGEQKPLSLEQRWLQGKAEILPHLEREFYKQGHVNDVRHFFFEVLDGKRQAADMDALLRTYPTRIHSMGPEEFLDLFFLKKKIDVSYMGAYLPLLKEVDGFWSQLRESVRLNQISQADYAQILDQGIRTAPYDFARKSLEFYGTTESASSEKRTEAFDAFFQNIFTSPLPRMKDIHSTVLYEDMRNFWKSSSFSPEEKKYLVKGYFERFLESEEMHDKITAIVDLHGGDIFSGAFTDTEQEAFVKKLFQTKNPDAVRSLITNYFGGGRVPQAENGICSAASLEDAKAVVRTGIGLDKAEVNTAIVWTLDAIPDEERELFLETLLAKPDLFENAGRADSIRSFCGSAARKIENERQKPEAEKKISEDYSQRLFSKIFASSKIDEETLSILSEHHSGFLVGNKEIFNDFVSVVGRKGSPSTGFSVLQRFTEAGRPIVLSSEQVKELSIHVLQDRTIDGEMYEMYRSSSAENPKFYLDRELFDGNIEKILRSRSGNWNVDIFGAIRFLQQQREAQGSGEALVLGQEQEELLVKRLAGIGSVKTTNLESLYDFDQDLFKSAYKNAFTEESITRDAFYTFLETKDELVQNFSREAIRYSFRKETDPILNFDLICKRFAGDPALLHGIKASVDAVSNEYTRSVLHSELLQRDLFEPEELKVLYDDIRKREDVRSAVLQCAELLGSLASAKQPEKMRNFFSQGDAEVATKIENISSFVTKYPFENKGRTIAVMLFAKEYLPDRSPEEVVKKVAEQLAKHERVLEQYKYEGIPEGLHASMGMEYEITGSTAQGYATLTGRQLKDDIVRLSRAAHIGSGADAVHEIATRPATNPYLMLLELQLLNDIEYVDFNFDRSPEYQKGSRGYHLTIGGETGLNVNANTQFLQNAMLAASWGGIHAGETGKRVHGGRGVTLRGRPPNQTHNVKVFENATPSVEMRSLAIDKLEPFQRSVITSFHGAIAIQALEKYTNQTSDTLGKYLYVDDPETGVRRKESEEKFFAHLAGEEGLKEESDLAPNTKKIIYAWAELVSEIQDAVKYHNTNFLQGETLGYLDKNNVWVDTETFGGEYNKNRFSSIVESIDPNLSVEEYVASTAIDFNDMFSSFDTELGDSFTKINNLYLKPSTKSQEKEGTSRGGAGDQANAIAMLQVTKLDNETLERRDDPSYLNATIFDTLGERREGYYNAQGGSERMITHAVQRALLSFNKKMEGIVNAV